MECTGVDLKQKRKFCDRQERQFDDLTAQLADFKVQQSALRDLEKKQSFIHSFKHFFWLFWQDGRNAEGKI